MVRSQAAFVLLGLDKRFKYRNIPGPFGWPVLGNLVQIATRDITLYIQDLEKEYGSIFKVTRCLLSGS